MDPSEKRALCGRIARLRKRTTGPEGESAFAGTVGLPPGSCDACERTGVPPTDVLVRMADAAGADLRWLLTGEAGSLPDDATTRPTIARAARLLADKPRAAEALAAFLDILSEAAAFPGGLGGGEGQSQSTEAPDHTAAPASGDRAPAPDAGWLPVLGRSAAGLPQFWADDAEARGLVTLGELIARHAADVPQASTEARLAMGEGRAEVPVQVVTLPAPPPGSDAVEFVAVGELAESCPDAFALRIDGDSMAPHLAHGDLVILSPSVPPADGRAAVVQLRGQIGVTCKLYRREGDTVHLVPIHPEYEPAAVEAGDVLWALRVLARVRV